ncbi:MAG: alpha/beta fold hydrolase [Henriciella sp.]|nr:alpha/beta fold hydrolase [Henriciella sp.]
MLRELIVGGTVLGLSACAVAPSLSTNGAALPIGDVSTQAPDGIAVYGTTYFADLPETAQLIVLFHQGGSNARGEYAPLIPWLNQNGYRLIAWDLRAGGDLYGEENRTAQAMLPAKATSYCEAYGDMQAALEFSVEYSATNSAIIWGYSYSAALVFHLAADAPDQVSRLVAASPASGPPMAACLARARLDDLTRPALVLRPASEMRSPSAQEQKQLLEDAQIPVWVLEDGVHGSSMLVDSRTEANMSEFRAAVIAWLAE